MAARKLGLTDAITIGVGSMVGAGVFSVWGPAFAAAGSGLLAALVVAALVAYCNAMSSARLAARYPEFGGTYVYGRERLGPFWGYLAGWCFVVGKMASCAVMALTVGTYLVPAGSHAVAVAAVLALTALSYGGIQRSALATRIIVAVVLAVLAAVVATGLFSGAAEAGRLTPVTAGVPGILEAAGLMFFAFAGYARLATLGEDVANPARTIPRAIPIALGIALVVYSAVAVTFLAVLGDDVTHSSAVLVDVVQSAGAGWLAPAVQVAAVLAALGALLALLLGVSRTTVAMARDGYLPRRLAAVHHPTGVPRHAELAIGSVVAALAAVVDLHGAIGFSSFGVLLYYAIANASAWTLGRRLMPALGLVGCLVLALSLPGASMLAGAGVVAVGAALYTKIGPTPRDPREGADSAATD